VLVAIVVALVAAGCSLRQAVESGSLDYRDMMEEFANQALVTNILRARDKAPLHYADLSQIALATTAQATVAPTFLLGPNPSATLRNTIGGSIEFTTAPTVDIAPLDTEAFTVGILQPINPVYFATYWENGTVDRRLLAYLFIDSIRYNPAWLGPGGPPRPGTCSQKPLPDECRANRWLKNDPTSDTYCLFAKFVSQVASANDTSESDRPLRVPSRCLTTGGDLYEADQARLLRFKTFTVLVPFGQEFTLAAGGGSPRSGSGMTLQFSDLNGVDENSVHLGVKKPGTPPVFQLYRRYYNQLGLCYGRVTETAMEAAPPSVPLPLGPISSASARSADTSGPAAAVGKAGGASGPPMAAPTLSMIGSILDPATCRQSELVAGSDASEDELAQSSGNYLEIRLRSVSGIIKYLGEVQRLVENPESGLDNVYVNDREILFHLFPARPRGKADAVRMRAEYRGKAYYVSGEAGDHTLEVLAILNEMINTNKVSSDIPTTKQVQVIP